MREQIEIKGGSFSYKVSGEGAAVLLLHGWGCNADIFASLQSSLENRFKVYSIDFQGFGSSDAPSSVWGVAEYTQALEEFVAKLKIDNPILIGHSFGGRVSIVYAARNKVDKIIIVDGAGVKPKRTLKYYYKVYTFKVIKKLLPILIGTLRASKIIDNRRKSAGSTDYNAAEGIMKQVFVKVVNEDLRCYMPKIKAPTLLVWGENDTATPLRDGRIMEKLIPGAGLVILKNAGHYSFLDSRYEFELITNKFL